ncbi:hypothetical protein ILYODFUR_029296 [Ilyodon furcidens]|uniref:Uncharacterized protein n=1 Tax=Ilyodon furcidens TaxID=33524 RepID=A0ABV0T1M6_9TELE
MEEVCLLQKRGFYSNSDVTGSPLLFPVPGCAGNIAFIISFIRSTCFMPISPTVFTCAMLHIYPSVQLNPHWSILFWHAKPVHVDACIS